MFTLRVLSVLSGLLVLVAACGSDPSREVSRVTGSVVRGSSGPVSQYEIGYKEGLPTNRGFWETGFAGGSRNIGLFKGPSYTVVSGMPWPFARVDNPEGSFDLTEVPAGDVTVFVRLKTGEGFRWEVRGVKPGESRSVTIDIDRAESPAEHGTATI